MSYNKDIMQATIIFYHARELDTNDRPIVNKWRAVFTGSAWKCADAYGDNKDHTWSTIDRMRQYIKNCGCIINTANVVKNGDYF